MTDSEEADATADDAVGASKSGPDDAFEVAGPNVFVDNRRRRIPGVLHCILGAAALIAWLVRAGNDPVLVNAGLGIAGIGLIAFGIYSITAGIGLDVDEEAALAAAAVAVQRPMGHAAAQLGWRGYRSRPTWRILWYSAEEPPRHRGLVFVDGHDGQVLEVLVEDNPEGDQNIDWRLDDADS